MKLFKLIALFVLATAPAIAAQYAGVEVGTTSLELTNRSDSGLKVGYKGAIKYGYVFENGFRAELDCSYRRNDFKTVYTTDEKDEVLSKEHRNFHAWSYMVNGLYDINPLAYQGFSPYLGLGIGYAQNTEHNKVAANGVTTQEKLRDNRISYQAILGLKYSFAESYAACVQYQYVLGQSHAKAHSVGLSLLKHF